jgi:hypothetical protein
VETFLTQLLALLAFFAFPIFEYMVLKYYTRYEGQPQLWYLPTYGFRLVIRNLPRKKKLYDIKYRSILRKIIPKGSGASVKTFDDIELLVRSDFFLLPGTDQILVQFKLERDDKGIPNFIHTDKLGNEISRTPFHEFERLISDYVATVHNFFHFNMKLQKRVTISRNDLIRMLVTIEHENYEREFAVSKIVNVG